MMPSHKLTKFVLGWGGGNLSPGFGPNGSHRAASVLSCVGNNFGTVRQDRQQYLQSDLSACLFVCLAIYDLSIHSPKGSIVPFIHIYVFLSFAPISIYLSIHILYIYIRNTCANVQMYVWNMYVCMYVWMDGWMDGCLYVMQCNVM